jgi:hypothetical protein
MIMQNFILKYYCNSLLSVCNLKNFLGSHTPGGLESHIKREEKEKGMQEGEARKKRRVMGGGKMRARKKEMNWEQKNGRVGFVMK